MKYYQEDIKQVEKKLATNKEKGLGSSDVTLRLKEYGFNELVAEQKISPIKLFFGQFKNFIIYILLFAVGISILSHEYIDAAIILIILFFNAIFGFIQEYKAEKSIQALKKLSGLKAKVIREGKTILVETKELCPGDILILEEGVKISADARLIQAKNLQIDEASLTGESAPVSKHANTIDKEVPINDQKNMIFSGTNVTRGKGIAIITNTGMKTELGKIAQMITSVEDEQTPLQKKLDVLGKWIGIATILACVIIFIIGVIKDQLYTHLFQGDIIGFIFAAKVWFLTAVSLAVAAVPEGLPAIVTISLALGVNRMLKRNTLVRKLPSIETLGETTVICSDKTGTITKNEMTVTNTYTFSQERKIETQNNSSDNKNSITLTEDETLLFTIGVLCNDSIISGTEISKAEKVQGDPTETALIYSAQAVNLNLKKIHQQFPRLNEIPFDSERKMMTTIHQEQRTKNVTKTLAFAKGAPERILEKCTHIQHKGKVIKLTNKYREQLLQQNKQFAKQALRVLAFAYREIKETELNEAISENLNSENIENKLIFVGLQGMRDPPHDEVAQAIKQCTTAGIRVMMITGDNQYTAQSIAQEVGIIGDVMNGTEFAQLSHSEQLKKLDTVSIFSRVEPQHKMLIVSLLQEKGEIVTMTGDGVNDAPAVKKADLGIAMGIAGTDVTKEASKMVVLDDNFASIVHAVEEGRWIYANIKKFVNYLLSCNIGEVLVITFAIMFNWHLPMTAIMLLWLNLVTDGLPALALSVDPKPKNIMHEPPTNARESIMNKELFIHIMYVSILITIATLGIFYWGQQFYSESATMIEKTQTLAFTAIIMMEIVRLQAIRSEYQLGFFSNTYLVLAVGISIALQLVVLYTPLTKYFGTVPLSLLDWLVILVSSTIVFVLSTFGTRTIGKLVNRKSQRDGAS